MSSTGYLTMSALSSTTASTTGTTAAATGAAHATVAAGAAHTAAVSATTAAIGTIAIGALAAAGAGVLIAHGLMWCGEQMEANYQQACNRWSAFENQAEAESRANVQETSNYVTSQIEFLSASEFASSEDADDPSVSPQQLAKVVAAARGALTQSDMTEQTKAAREKEMLLAKLWAEIKTGRGALPENVLAEAEQALQAPPEEVQKKLNELDKAWRDVKETRALRDRTIRQTKQVLTLVSARLGALDSMARDSEPRYRQRLRQLYDQVQTAREDLKKEDQPEQTWQLATRIQQEAEALFEEISASAQQAWSEQRKIINTQLGTLDALTQMVEEVKAHQLTELFNTEKLALLIQRIAKWRSAGKRLLAGDSQKLSDDIKLLSKSVELLKGDVFAEVATGQQSRVANLIRETLVEEGFRSQAGEAPVITQNGDITRVEVMTSPVTTTTERQDRVISFDITRNGQVSYDFGGYMGAACIEDAQKVFAALHKKGIYLLNEAAMHSLQNLPLKNIVKEIVEQERHRVTPEQNKTQAELADTIQGVLNKMGYEHVRVSSIGGSIEMEAFNGNTGYRVIMSPEGEIQVQDGQHRDITNKASDPVVQASKKVQEESPEVEMKERKKSYMGSRKRHMLSH